MEAGFDETDQFQRLIIDPGDIRTEQQQLGILYVARTITSCQRQLETCR